MNCTNCGAVLGPPRPVDLPYDKALGVILIGIPAHRCPACGDIEYEIAQLDLLDLTIAAALVAKPGRLTGGEIRFLRGLLGWPGKTLAHRIGVTPETLSRWENAALVIGETPDKLLRMFVLHEKRVEEPFGLDSLDRIAKTVGEPLDLRLSLSNGWRALAA